MYSCVGFRSICGIPASASVAYGPKVPNAKILVTLIVLVHRSFYL
jgi:hypothetical protein